MVTEVSLQLLNALDPIEVTESGMVIDFKVSHQLIALREKTMLLAFSGYEVIDCALVFTRT